MGSLVRLAPLVVLFLLASTYKSESGVSLAGRGDRDAVRIEIQDLGTLIQSGRSSAVAISNRGHVVGFASIDPLDLSREGPFLWSPEGGMQSILESVVPDLFLGAAWDLNDHDDVVGTFHTFGGDGFHGFVWSRDEGLLDLGTEFFPAAINNRRQIAGVCRAPELGDDEFPGAVACLWDDGVLRPLGISLGPGPWSPERIGQVGGINARGEIVFTDALGVAWLWSPRDGAVPLPLAMASDISNSGLIVGHSGEHMVVVLRRTDILRRIRHLFVPTAINSRGWVVGYELGDVSQTSFLWRPNGIVTTLPSPTQFSYAGAINDRGQVAGNVMMEDGLHAVVWTVRASNNKE